MFAFEAAPTVVLPIDAERFFVGDGLGRGALLRSPKPRTKNSPPLVNNAFQYFRQRRVASDEMR